VLVELVYHMASDDRDGLIPCSTWHEAEAIQRGHARYLTPALRTSNAIPLTPQRWRVNLQEVPGQRGDLLGYRRHMLFNVHELCIRASQRFVRTSDSDRWAMEPRRPSARRSRSRGAVWPIIGDACFAMNGMELLTAAEYGVP